MYPPVKWVLFKEGNLQIGRSNARVLVRAGHILGALKYPRLDSASDKKKQPSTLGGETRVGVGIP